MLANSRKSLSLLLVVALGASVVAETWSDISGKFTIEAEFVGVEGKSIVLLKSDGNKITVPIAALSADSRTKAKTLYEKMLSQPGSGAAGDAQVRPARKLNFTPPAPAAIAPLPPFPDELSVQQTVDFVKQQVLAGHPEVLWYALPTRLRDAIEDDAVREAVSPFVTKQTQMGAQFEPIVFKAIQILVTKKQFILGSAMMQQVPPTALPMVQQGYDPGVGLVYELADLTFSLDAIRSSTITDLANYHGPRIGGHAKALLAMAPPQMVDGYLSGIEIEMVDDSHAIVRMPKTETDEFGGPGFGDAAPGPPGAANGFGGPGAAGGGGGGGLNLTTEVEEIKLAKFDKRWVPQELADQFDESTGKLRSDIGEALEQAEQANAEQTQGMMMMAGMMAGAADAVLTSLLNANSQQEFDQALTQAMTMMNPLGPGGPGGPGLGGPPGFGPPGGGAPGLNFGGDADF